MNLELYTDQCLPLPDCEYIDGKPLILEQLMYRKENWKPLISSLDTITFDILELSSLVSHCAFPLTKSPPPCAIARMHSLGHVLLVH